MSVIYICGYNGMVSTYAWLAGGEIPSQRLRSYTFGLAAAVGFAGAWLATFTAPYFINPDALNWGPEYGASLSPLPHLLKQTIHTTEANLSTYRLDLGPLVPAHRRLGLLLPARDQEQDVGRGRRDVRGEIACAEVQEVCVRGPACE